MKLTKNEMKALKYLSTATCGRDFMPMTILTLARDGLVERYSSVVSFHDRFRITDAGRRAATDGEAKP